MLQLHVLHPISQWSGACAVLCHRSFPKVLVGKRVYPLHIVACVSYTYLHRWIIIETHAAVEMA